MMNQHYGLNGFRLCIDECQNNVHKGRVYMPLSKHSIPFNDLTNMVLLVDKVYDRNDYPKAYQHKRSFYTEELPKHKPELKYPIDKLLQQQGEIASFDILVMTRQHTSWQGLIKKTSGEVIDHFDSDLDLIQIISNLIK